MVSTSTDIEQTFVKAYDDYADAIFRHCYFRVFHRERAKELMQEAFLRVWEYIQDGNRVENIRAFLYRVANNLIIDDARKKKEMSLENLQEAGFDPGIDDTHHMQDKMEVQQILHRLKDVQKEERDVLIMRYIDGLMPSDIAVIMGVPANTISVRLHRGLKHLCSLLKYNHG